MDVSGNNRYELLFMDDDAGAATMPLDVGAIKKRPEDLNAKKKSINKTEKENKPSVLNKNDALAKGLNLKGKSTSAPASESVKNQGKGGLAFASKNIANGTAHKEKTTNRNFGRSTAGENRHTEYGNEVPNQRQFRDRDMRGPSRFRNGDKLGKREFDRQSGSDKTGIKPIDKREGGGAHNWGSAKQDIEDINKTGEAAPSTEKEDSSNEQAVDTINSLEEDESKQMTLDEWKALREQRSKPNYNLRKAGEGVDNSEWKKMVVLSKKKELDGEEDFEYDPSMYPQRVGRLQRVVDIQFNFNDGRRGGFRKGPRPSTRDGPRVEFGGNGFERTVPNKFAEKRRTGSKPLKVDDEQQFPTLS